MLYRGPSWWLVTLYILLGIAAGGFVGFTLAMRFSKRFNKRVRESVLFKKSGLHKSSVMRKSLALPPLEELEHLYEDADEDDEKKALNGKGTNGNGMKYMTNE